MIRLLIADGRAMFREGVARLLKDVDGFAVAAEVEDDASAIAVLKARRIDVAVLDHALPKHGAIALIRDAKAIQPSVRTLTVSASVQDPHLLPALHAGSEGYITKENSSAELIGAIRRIASGGRYICPAVAERQTLDFIGADAAQPGHMRLSHREFEVFRLLVEGRRGADIAAALTLSEKTVSSHKTSVLRKLKVAGVADLVRYAVRHDLVSR